MQRKRVSSFKNTLENNHIIQPITYKRKNVLTTKD